jgi:hypothetical protein
LREIEEEDQAWENARRSKPKHGKNLEENKAVEQAVEQKDTNVIVEKTANKNPGIAPPEEFY